VLLPPLVLLLLKPLALSLVLRVQLSWLVVQMVR
jgi:hypothetical protein